MTKEEYSYLPEQEKPDEEIQEHNVHKMESDLGKIGTGESIGLNSPVMIIDGKIHQMTITARGYANPKTGEIITFGNVQDIDKDVRDINAEFKMIVAISIEKAARRENALFKVELYNEKQDDAYELGHEKISERAAKNIQKSIEKYNEKYR